MMCLLLLSKKKFPVFVRFCIKKRGRDRVEESPAVCERGITVVDAAL